MKDLLFLAWQYLRYHRIKTTVLILSISLILFIPLGLNEVVSQGAALLTDRAESTPLLIGARGSETELTLSSLYFREPRFNPIPYREVLKVNQSGLAEAIPLHLQFQVQTHRIVGTTPEYFDFRRLDLETGRRPAILGECVLGAVAARNLGASVGASVISSPAGAFDVAGSYPLKMKVAGILKPSATADDQAVFVDIKTAWVIAGLAHGHQDVARPGADSLLMESSGHNLVANPSVLSYTEITPENIGSFHFHGDPESYPVDAIILQPVDRRSGIIIRGRYQERSDDIQLVAPLEVVQDLIDTMFSIRDTVLLAGLVIGLATLATLILVFSLSIRLRKREIDTMRKIGAPRSRIRQLLALEIGLVAGAAALISLALTLLVSRFGAAFVTAFF